jgi:curved DNA-binding protein CbpA
METKNLYKVLELSREASQDDIRKAHRKLVRKYHPDANPEDPRAEERFKEIQQAYEVLSNEKKRQEYDERLLRTASRGRSGKPRAGASSRASSSTGGGTTYTVDLSELLAKLANLSSESDGRGRKGGSYELRGEEVAHLAKLLGEKISRISELLGKDPARLATLLSEKIKAYSKAGSGEVQTGEFSATNVDVLDKTRFGMSSRKPREKKVKGPRAQGRVKRVKGPKARRNGRSS